MTISNINDMEYGNAYHIALNSLNVYQAMRLADTTSGPFLTGQLLVPFERERKYLERTSLWYWPNYIKPILDALVDPIFEKQGYRSEIKSDLFNEFQKNVDLKGRTLQKFMKLVTRDSKRFGSVFIVVDNFSDMPSTKDEVLKQRKMPYVYIRTPENVAGYSKDRTGNLSSITFEENFGDLNINQSQIAEMISSNQKWSDVKPEDKKVYVEWSANSYKVFEDKEKKNLLSSFDHKLGKLPVVTLFGTDNNEEILPSPPLYSILQINLNIANISSEIRYLERSQAFSLLTYPINPENAEKFKGLTLGSSNALLFDGSLSQSPAYISPDSAIVKSLQDEIVRLVQEMFRISSLESVNSEQKVQSGISKQWSFRITNSILSQLAESAEIAEQRIAELFGLWTKTDMSKYSVSYTRDYGVIDSLSELSLAELAKALNVGNVFNAELNKKIARLFFREDDPATLKAIIDDIESQSLEEKNARDAGFKSEVEPE
jgi:hypothetical protein